MSEPVEEIVTDLESVRSGLGAAASEPVLTVRDLPALDLAATLVHVGPTGDTHRGYGLLAGWLEAHGWDVLGPGRQVLWQLPLAGPQDEAVVELQLPVGRRAPGA